MTSRTALLVIDMQVALVQGAYQEGEVLDRIRTLLAKARAAATPIIYLQHDHDRYPPMKTGAPGWHIHPAIAPAEGELVIRKRASDGFYQTSLHHELTARGISDLIITGMQTEYCVDTTCRQAASLGYNVTLVSDAHTTGNTELLTAAQIVAHHNTTLGNLAHPDHAVAVKPTAVIEM